MILTTLDRDSAFAQLKTLIKPAGIVLDVGCGLSPQTYVKPAVHICLDAYTPYIEMLRTRQYDPKTLMVFVNSHWRDFLTGLKGRSVDTIFALDFIEHLHKPSGYDFIRECRRLVKQQIVLFTPVGFYEQAYALGQKDNYGMDGGFWQTHRSGWLPDDFPGWTVVNVPGYHEIDQHGKPFETPMGAMWCIWNANGV